MLLSRNSGILHQNLAKAGLSCICLLSCRFSYCSQFLFYQILKTRIQWQLWLHLSCFPMLSYLKSALKNCQSMFKGKLFIEIYYAPFTPKHCFWTGLLLIARTILYLVAAANVSNNSQLALSAIVFTVICILFLIAFIDIRMYTKIPLNLLDIFFILNLLFFSVLSSLSQWRSQGRAW